MQQLNKAAPFPFNPFPNNKFLTLPNSEFTDDNTKFDENGRKFFKWVENTEEKGEIARYKQFPPFPLSVFKRLVLQTRKNQGLFGKRLTYKPVFQPKRVVLILTLYPTIKWLNLKPNVHIYLEPFAWDKQTLFRTFFL